MGKIVRVKGSVNMRNVEVCF